MQILVDLADQFQRKVAFVGRGMLQTSEAAQRLGYLEAAGGPDDSRHRGRVVAAIARALLATGSQENRSRRCRASRSTITAREGRP